VIGQIVVGLWRSIIETGSETYEGWGLQKGWIVYISKVEDITEMNNPCSSTDQYPPNIYVVSRILYALLEVSRLLNVLLEAN